MEHPEKKVILIVDDIPENIELLGQILSAKYQVKVALNGLEALQIAGGPEPPDLILLDIMMPLVDGYEVCRALKENPQTLDIPVVFLTALSNEIDEFAGLELGAIDYISKPFTPRAIELRVQNHLNLRAARQELQYALMDLQAAQKNEVEVASEIQQTLLLGKPLEGVKGVEVAAFTRASLGVDGDFYDFFKIDGKTFDVLFGDVMGKGIPAGLVGAATKTNFQRAMSTFLVSSDCRIPDPEALVNAVHSEMTPRLMQVGRFVSLHYARFDLEEGTLDLVIAGHTPLLHLHASTGIWEEHDSGNAPLGINEEGMYKGRRIRIAPGDFFLFCSDGVPDSRTPDGEFYGLARVEEFVKSHSGLPPNDLLEALHGDLENFTRCESFSDDLTMIAIRL